MTDKLSHKERTRARILDEAAAAMRLHGHDGIGVATLMKRAGLTHGGFYAHFASRDDLVAHVIDRMFADSRAMVARHLEGAEPKSGLSGLIDYYLAERVLRARDAGCPLPSLSGEAARMPQAARARFAAGYERFRASIAAPLRALGHADADLLAASLLAEMIGTVALARALEDDAAAVAMLAAARARLKERLDLNDAA